MLLFPPLLEEVSGWNTLQVPVKSRNLTDVVKGWKRRKLQATEEEILQKDQIKQRND